MTDPSTINYSVDWSAPFAHVECPDGTFYIYPALDDLPVYPDTPVGEIPSDEVVSFGNKTIVVCFRDRPTDEDPEPGTYHWDDGSFPYGTTGVLGALGLIAAEIAKMT